MIPMVSFDPNGFLRSEHRAEKHLIQSRGRFVLNLTSSMWMCTWASGLITMNYEWGFRETGDTNLIQNSSNAKSMRITPCPSSAVRIGCRVAGIVFCSQFLTWLMNVGSNITRFVWSNLFDDQFLIDWTRHMRFENYIRFINCWSNMDTHVFTSSTIINK